MAILPTTIPTKRLQASITASATTFQLSDILGWDGTALTSASLGSPAYAVFRNANNTLIEIMEIDAATIASASITINKRGLNYTGDLTTQSTSRKLSWTKGTYVELGTHFPQYFQWLKEYIDTASISGAVPATTSANGITRMSIAPANSLTPIAVGDNDSRIPQNAYGVDAAINDTYAITLTNAPAAYAAGQQFTFKANTANTGAATLNVNGLGAVALKKQATLDLVTGDILAGQIVLVEYDGTYFQVLSGLTLKTPTVQTFTSTGTWTKPTGLKYVIAEVVGGGGGGGGTTSIDTGCGGGGGGGYSRKLIAASSLGATETATVGAAGTAGAASGGAGGSGGTSSFGTHLQATGGAGGSTGSTEALGGVGGVGSLGDVNLVGQDGGTGGSTANAQSAVGGAGGCSHMGGGGGSTLANNSVSEGLAGSLYGGGGSGSSAGDSGSDAVGGAGAKGIVIVTEYY